MTATDSNETMPASELRKGNLKRVNQKRTISCSCMDCDAEFTNTGTAASHSRASRHRVTVDYRVVFAYLPGEMIDKLVTP